MQILAKKRFKFALLAVTVLGAIAVGSYLGYKAFAFSLIADAIPAGKGCQFKEVKPGGQHPLHLLKFLTKRDLAQVLSAAIVFKDFAYAKILVGMFKDPNDMLLYYTNPVTEAAKVGDYELVEMLLGRGLSPDGDSKWDIPLFAAAQSDDEKMIKLLVKRGANLNTVHHLGYQTAFERAVGLEKENAVKTLLELEVNSAPLGSNKEKQNYIALAYEEYKRLNSVRKGIKTGKNRICEHRLPSLSPVECFAYLVKQPDVATGHYLAMYNSMLSSLAPRRFGDESESFSYYSLLADAVERAEKVSQDKRNDTTIGSKAFFGSKLNQFKENYSDSASPLIFYYTHPKEERPRSLAAAPVFNQDVRTLAWKALYKRMRYDLGMKNFY